MVSHRAPSVPPRAPSVPPPARWAPLLGLTVDTVASTFESPHSTFGPFLCDRYAMAWVVEGGGLTTLDASPIETKPGTVLLMRPGMVLRHDWGRARSFQSFIVFGFPRLPAGWPAEETWPLVRVASPSDAVFELWRVVLAGEHGAQGRSPLVEPGVELLLRMVLTGLTDARAQTSAGFHEAVDRALLVMSDWLEREPEQRLALEELASKVGITAQHLCRLFQRDLAISPMECLEVLRLERAGSMLERSEDSLAIIAGRLGFSSAFHLSKRFKLLYGVPPSDYRLAFRAGFATRPAGLPFRYHRLRHYLWERGAGKILGSAGQSRGRRGA